MYWFGWMGATGTHFFQGAVEARRGIFFSSTNASILTMTSDRLSPPPRARERAFSIRNYVASRGESESTTEASSVGEK